MKLNCDLGESFAAWEMGADAEVMPHIHMANIACGFHASDPVTIERTLSLAAEHKVEVGAHPGYPDLLGFGRRSMKCSEAEIRTLLHYQVAALSGMAAVQGINVSYVKPHGALYNDMMRDLGLFLQVLTAIAMLPGQLALVLQANADNDTYQKLAERAGVRLMFEAFADRGYDEQGLLLPRGAEGAVLTDPSMILERAQGLQEEGVLHTHSGKALKLSPDTLCVHGDNAAGIAQIKQLRQLLDAL